ncbi:hypothetical protein [Microbacterium sp. SCN 71-21]|uniref:hypothetical protein n=1 Tax=Microbacterium sp. SCN 71-21 TaxID=1660116 RepID=UPI0025842003|nr:hypothetical protein [Microbacterium sp. SCN 71-21]
MRRIWRLLLYVQPYALYSLLSVLLMAVVGAMAAFRLLLVKPIFDNVLSPNASANILVFKVPHLGWSLDLNFLVPSHFHNAWDVVAYALVVSALLKSVCDYAGTYLVNYAGFGMITDLRNDLYDAILRRSIASPRTPRRTRTRWSSSASLLKPAPRCSPPRPSCSGSTTSGGRCSRRSC